MVTSQITHKTYNNDNGTVLYITNMLQVQKYLNYLGPEFLYDILWTSSKRKDSLVFVFPRCPETKKAKELWDKHEL